MFVVCCTQADCGALLKKCQNVWNSNPPTKKKKTLLPSYLNFMLSQHKSIWKVNISKFLHFFEITHVYFSCLKNHSSCIVILQLVRTAFPNHLSCIEVQDCQVSCTLTTIITLLYHDHLMKNLWPSSVLPHQWGAEGQKESNLRSFSSYHYFLTKFISILIPHWWKFTSLHCLV